MPRELPTLGVKSSKSGLQVLQGSFEARGHQLDEGERAPSYPPDLQAEATKLFLEQAPGHY